MNMSLARPGYIPLRRFMQVELLVSSALPVAALLLLSTVGTDFIPGVALGRFLFVLVLCMLGAFFGELAITMYTQRATRKQIVDFSTICQEYLAGNTSRRVVVQGDDEMAIFAQLFNTLLDTTTAQVQNGSHQSQHNEVSQDSSFLRMELERLVRVVSPVLDGDLRVRAEVTSDIVGAAADIYNYLTEELDHLIRQLQSTANQILSATRDLLDRSIELAQVTETQMLSLSQTTEKIEVLVTFIQRLTNTLQIGTETNLNLHQHLLAQEKTVQDEDSEQKEPAAVSAEEQLLQVLRTGIQQQKQLFASIDYSVQEHMAGAEEMVGEVYQLAQHTHQSSMGVLSAAERISALAILAETLRDSVASFRLPAEPYKPRRQSAQAQNAFFASTLSSLK